MSQKGFPHKSYFIRFKDAVVAFFQAIGNFFKKGLSRLFGKKTRPPEPEVPNNVPLVIKVPKKTEPLPVKQDLQQPVPPVFPPQVLLSSEPTVVSKIVAEDPKPASNRVIEKPQEDLETPGDDDEAFALEQKTIEIAKQIQLLIEEFRAIETQYSFGIEMSWLNNVYKRNREDVLSEGGELLSAERYQFRLTKLNKDLIEMTGMLKNLKVLAKRADAQKAQSAVAEVTPSPSLKK